MAENDIYNSQKKYTNFVAKYKQLHLRPDQGSQSKYFCQNKDNLQYFPPLFKIFDRKDLSFIRRLRLLQTFKFICWATTKNLKSCTRDDIDDIVIKSHKTLLSSKSKGDFIIDIKHIWKCLFPEKDNKGRIDETLMPYVVRHLSGKIDRSKDKRRDDKLTIDEFEKLIKSFSQDKRLQAFLTLEWESLGRPQEILYAKIKDVEMSDNYAKVWISEHGKEGTGYLQSIDSFPYLAAWLNEHPLRHDPNAFLFLNLGQLGRHNQLTPFNINKHIREHLDALGIKKRVTCYSFKRNGVTYRRLRGDSDASIQHTARWTSTKQLKAYDLSTQDDTFKQELIKRGIIKDKSGMMPKQIIKLCAFCGHSNGISNDLCSTCKRPLDRDKIKKENEAKEQEIELLRKQIADMPMLFNELINQKLEKLKEVQQKSV